MTAHDIHQRLIALGAKEEEIEKIVQDVQQIILLRVCSDYVQCLTKAQRETLEVLPKEEVFPFIEAHQDEYPHLEPAKVEAMMQEVWQEYFSSMG